VKRPLLTGAMGEAMIITYDNDIRGFVPPAGGCDLNHNEDRPVPPSSTCRHEVGRVAGVCIRCGAVYRLGRWVKVTK
jgi:hypothetical protein